MLSFWMLLGSVLLVHYMFEMASDSVEEITVDQSATLDYSYYDSIQGNVSVFDQTMTTLDFDPDDE